MEALDLTVITPTGDRPIPFSLCRRWMARQTIQPLEWLVVDDGIVPLPEEQRTGCTYLRRERGAGEPAHTLPLNLLVALQHIKSKYIVIMEDDDWYAPNYLEAMLSIMPRSALGVVGQDHTFYYRLEERAYIQASVPSNHRASLCATGFVAGFIPVVAAVCHNAAKQGNGFVDLFMWDVAHAKSFLCETVCIGI